MIKKIIIGLILLVCICSSTFSVMSYYNPTNNSDMDNMGSSSVIGNTNEDDIKSVENNLFINYMDYIDDTLQYSYGYIVNINGELRHYINSYGVYYLESEGLTDRYIECIECGGFQPIGKITNPLPKAAICHHDASGGLAPNYKDFSYSRDEAYDIWIKSGMPVYDETHLSNFTNFDESIHYEAIYCNDCDGYVILKNDWNTIVNSDYNSVLNTLSIGVFDKDDIHYCFHHNGTLDLFDMPIENFHSGWFKSTEDYNQWLNENTEPNENNHSIDDTAVPIENDDFTHYNSEEDLLNNTENGE